MTDTGQVTFEFYRFNPRRMRRGAEAVQLKVYEGGNYIDLLWMTRKDINANIRAHGMCETLRRGLECYQTGKDPKQQS